MLRSDGRILTTHAGSLPRRERLVAMLVKQSRGEEVDNAAMVAEIEASTRYVVEQQLKAGIDIGNNGEQSRESFFTYVQHRMSGFGGRSERPIMRDIVRYPSFLKMMAPLFQRSMVDLLHAPKAVGTSLFANLSLRQQALDVVQLHKCILEGILKISEDAIRNQENVTYCREATEALSQVRSGKVQVAFLMNPARMEQVRDIAFAGEVMPQKSTDFYPKLLTGLTIYALE